MGDKTKMKSKKTYSLFALGVIALLGISLVAAYQGDHSVEGPNYSEDRHEAMEQAFVNGDYDAWVALMTEDGRHPRVLEIVTEDNFETFVEIHEARMSGDFERVSELRAELGLGNKIGPKDGTGFKKGFKQGMRRGLMKAQGNCPHLE